VSADVNDPFKIGLSFGVEGFDLGSDYVSMMAARRESDVLLTDGHDGAWAFPGPSNASYGSLAATRRGSATGVGRQRGAGGHHQRRQ